MSYARHYGAKVKAQQTRSANEMIRLLPKTTGAGDENVLPAEENKTIPEPQFTTVAELWEWRREGAETQRSYHDELSRVSMVDCNSFGLCYFGEPVNAHRAVPDSYNQNNGTPPNVQVKVPTNLLPVEEKLTKPNKTLEQVIQFLGKLVDGDKTTTDDVVAAINRLSTALENTTQHAHSMRTHDSSEQRIPEHVNEIGVEYGLKGLHAFLGKDKASLDQYFNDYATHMRTLNFPERIATQQWFNLNVPFIAPNNTVQRLDNHG